MAFAAPRSVPRLLAPSGGARPTQSPPHGRGLLTCLFNMFLPYMHACFFSVQTSLSFICTLSHAHKHGDSPTTLLCLYRRLPGCPAEFQRVRVQ